MRNKIIKIIEKYGLWFFTIWLICMIALFSCNISRKAKPCKQCPQYTNKIESLKKQHIEDSIKLDSVESEYHRLWEENQIFSSMLSQIENEPGGHEILKKLWNEKM
tara:strand:+ start:1174 stop:1491 length:318 start_codon:yes stop_codon:yes gene_type:complete